MKTNSTLLIIGALIIVAGGLLFLYPSSGNRGGVSESASALKAIESFYDFGEIDIFGGTVSTVFQLKNEGSEDVVVESGTTSCGCTSAEIGGMKFGMHEDLARVFTIPAGETADLTVIYDPLAHGPSGVGLAQRSVFLKTNSSATPEIEVRIKAMVTNSN